jgi:ectoine hydroxylase-related dioxygenase (phytanoyl-CoA dioxygenase family)
MVSNQGEFYEFAGIITNPGSDRQQIHPDHLPHREEAPLYVIFLALQDITLPMGPTTFLVGTQSRKERDKFDDPSKKDEQLKNATSRVALLNKGDSVLFDARILHSGNANVDFDNDSMRMMFNSNGLPAFTKYGDGLSF